MIQTPDSPLPALEKSLLRIADLLRCASAISYETGDSLASHQRSMAFAAVHLIDIAKAEADLSLALIEAR